MRDWWRRRTLRFRLALWYALGGTFLLALFSTTIYTYVSRRIGLPLARQLRLDLAEVRAHLSIGADGKPRWDGRALEENDSTPWEGPWFDLWDGEQELLCRRWLLTSHQQVKGPLLAPAEGYEALSVFRVGPDLRLRALAVPYEANGRLPGGMLRVMRIHLQTSEALSELILIIVVTLPLVVALLVLGGYAITRRWLKPLDQMAAQAERISADDLSQRLPVTNPHDELGRLARAFNHTLSRLEDSFHALDRFVADASHELRTPLTALRSVGEVGLRTGRTTEEYREIVGSMLEEAERLQDLIERLLELANAEGGAKVARRERIVLDRFIAECVHEIEILAEQKSQRFQIDLPSAEIRSDPVLLWQALLNLIDNAMKYSPAGSTITIAAVVDQGICEFSVTDEGDGVPDAEVPRLADRFYRIDDARERGRGGFGLGLAITKAYMRVLGGTLGCRPAPGRGTRFFLRLPTG